MIGVRISVEPMEALQLMRSIGSRQLMARRMDCTLSALNKRARADWHLQFALQAGYMLYLSDRSRAIAERP